MLVERNMHPDWLSNTYVVAAETGGDALIVDSGVLVDDLVDDLGVRPRWLLRTHGHHDHVAFEDELAGRYGAEVIASAGDFELGGFRVRALPTPGHSDDHLAFVVNDEACFTGDVLFKGSVGGGDLAQVRRSVLEVLMELPQETRVYPGHTDGSTIGREWEENPFVRVWRGADSEGTERCSVGGREAALVVWSPDYDGGGKAWVRFDDGRDAIVGGSRITRGI